MKYSKNDIQKVLTEKFGKEEFRSSQEEIINHILEGKHSLILMPTGMGKSLCYQLPALIMEGLTIVLSPLISLMKDQVDKLRENKIDAVYINSSLSKNEREKRYKNILDGKYKILFVSPERFRKQDFIDIIKTRKISLLAVDEAHCVSQWGHDFRPDYSRIDEFRKMLDNPTTATLTATATLRVQEDIIKKTGIPKDEIKIFNEGICRPNLSLHVTDVIDESEKFNYILDQLKKSKGSKIVYFNLIKSIDKMKDFLDRKGFRCLVYHGKLQPEHRKKVQKTFIGSDNVVMLATNAFGMGVDKEDIRMIIHAEIPDSLESYYQEIGRAGRDGKPSQCILIYCEEDLAVQMEFMTWKNPDAPFIKKVYHHLKKLGDAVNSYTYEEIQEDLVYKNKGDHRLQTVLNIFDRNHVTEGSLDILNLKIISELPEEILADETINSKMQMDRQRLIDMLNYVKTEDCRRSTIHHYFGVEKTECGNCDNCSTRSI